MSEVGATAVGEGFDRTRAALVAGIEEGWFTRGAQVSIRRGGEEVLAWAGGDAGNGTPMTEATVCRVYCTIKPVTAVAVARQVDTGTLDLDEPLADRLPGVAAVADGRVALRHILTHTAGLQRPMAIEVELLAPAERDRTAASRDRAPGFRVGTHAAYSEWLGWHLLGRLLEDVTGEPLGQHLRSAVIEPLGLHDTWIGMTEEEHAANLHRIGVNVDLRRHAPYPLLMERGVRMCTEVNPAHGGYTTAGDLTRFYAAVLDRLAGADLPALPSSDVLADFTSTARLATYDQVLDRECEYGLGFMTGLEAHAFGRWPSPRSFGHSGNVGTSFAFADPDADLAVSVIFNGIVDHESAFLRRRALVRAVYDDLAELDGPAEEVEEEPVASGAPRRGWLRRRSG